MSKLLCKLCNELISPNDPNLQIVSESGGRLVVLERHGRAHILYNERETAEHLDPPSSVEYKVRVPEQSANTLQELFEAPEPTTEQPVESEAEPEPETESASVTEPEFVIDYGTEIDARIRDLPRRKGGYGFAFASHLPRSKSPSFVWFDEDIETMGTIYLGSLVRAVVTEPDPGHTIPRLRNIRIYQEN
jgi:hypothetical protein